MNVRDWFVILLVAAEWVAATVFIFVHPDTPNFMTWGTVTATIAATYRWLDLKDSKVPDAGPTR